MFTDASTQPSHTQIPRGVADYFWAEAYLRRRLEASLLELFRRWGYQDVIPPSFEHADTFLNRSNSTLQQELYRLLDRDGTTLALRADMTIPVARLVGVRLHDWPMPQRFCYAGSVFRHVETLAGRRREFSQAGLELVGAPDPAADAEVIALSSAAVVDAGIADFQLVVGHLQYFNGLLQDLKLNPDQAQQLQRAVDRNSEADLAEFLRTTPLRTQQRHTVEQLPLLSGSDAQRIIDHADRLCLNYTMHQALENLRAIYRVLEAYHVTDRVYLDLTEINNLGYYTGISFEVLMPGMGFPLGSGGRYDNLIGTFGPAQPAVGVALGIDRIVEARRELGNLPTDASVAPHVLVAPQDSAECYALIAAWRAAGLRVAVNLDGLTGEALAQKAGRVGTPLALTWTGSGFDLYQPGPQGVGPVTQLPAAAAARVIDLALAQDAGIQVR